MPTSKTCLPDVNVWLALASERHEHAPAASRWIDSADCSGIAFCRITQMGLLRLLTNGKVMGIDVVKRPDAWSIYDQIAEDHRITFLPEPQELEVMWRAITESRSFTPGDWTDAYLLAFAKARDLTLVTFDQGFKTVTDVRVTILPQV